MKKFVCAAVVTVMTFCLAQADEFLAVITKVNGDKVTYKKATFNKDDKKMEYGAETTGTAGSTVKVSKGKFNKEDKKLTYEAVEGGLKNEMFSKIEPKKGKGGLEVPGIMATITTEGDKITEIKLGGGFGGGKIKKGKDKQ